MYNRKGFAIIYFGLVISHIAFGQDKSYFQKCLKNKSVPKAAKDYYSGRFTAMDDNRTFQIIDSISTRNEVTRPFYLYLVSKMMKGSDGALSEVLRVAAKDVFDRRPDEAFQFLQSAVAEKQFFKLWAEAVAREIKIDCEGKEEECMKQWYQQTDRKISMKNRGRLKEFYQLMVRY